MALLSTHNHVIGDAFLNKQSPPGTYGLKFNIKAEPDPNCDPTQQECEQWLPGNYVVKVGEARTWDKADFNLLKTHAVGKYWIIQMVTRKFAISL